MIHIEVKVDHLEDRLLNTLQAKAQMCNRMLLEDIHRASTARTPLSKGLPTDGDLREMVTKRVNNREGTITWTVPYASYQERGKRFDGSHPVRNYTTPDTGPWFAKEAVKKSMNSNNIKRYLNFGSRYIP